MLTLGKRSTPGVNSLSLGASDVMPLMTRVGSVGSLCCTMTMGVTMSVRLNWRLSVQLKQHVTRHMYVHVHCLYEIRYFGKSGHKSCEQTHLTCVLTTTLRSVSDG